MDPIFPWTQLAGTREWQVIKDCYAANGRRYHDFNGHVWRIYQWAARLHIPYSRALDEAIATHDVIFDEKGSNELRSIAFGNALFFNAHDEERAHYIDATIAHRPSHTHQTMAMLDLADFLDSAQTHTNTELLFAEARDMKGPAFDKAAQVQGNIGYLSGLSARIQEDLAHIPMCAHRSQWGEIALGIDVTVHRLRTKDIPIPN